MVAQNETKAKAQYASCMNHLKHGATAKSLFIKEENPDDFFSLLENAFEQHRPAWDHDAALVVRCIKDHWILLRRERACEIFEVALTDRKCSYATWLEPDFTEMHRFDRYKTEAARSHQRSLKNLQTIQKMARDDERWQFQLTKEKQKLAIEVEKFNLLKQKAEATKPAPAAEAPADFTIPPFGSPTIPGLQQVLYIGYENDGTPAVIYEVTPSNDQIRRKLTEDDTVVRTYNFVGGVPPEYKHLITPDAITWGQSTVVQKIYSFEAWSSLASKE